jgi:hypothetical protein
MLESIREIRGDDFPNNLPAMPFYIDIHSPSSPLTIPIPVLLHRFPLSTDEGSTRFPQSRQRISPTAIGAEKRQRFCYLDRSNGFSRGL